MTQREVAILYVDDEEFNLFLFKNNFEASYPVFTASSGEEGLKVLKENNDKIIVVFSDMKMPSMNGVEFITKAREMYSNISYFIITGYSNNKEVDEALKNKLIKQWFSKPFNTQNIEKAIENVLSNLE